MASTTIGAENIAKLIAFVADVRNLEMCYYRAAVWERVEIVERDAKNFPTGGLHVAHLVSRAMARNRQPALVKSVRALFGTILDMTRFKTMF